MLTDLKINQPVSVERNSKLAEDIFNTLKVAAKHSPTPLPVKPLRICAQRLADLDELKNKGLKTKKEIKNIKENFCRTMKDAVDHTSPAYYPETNAFHTWVENGIQNFEKQLSVYPYQRRRDEHSLSRVVLHHTAQITARLLGFIPKDRHLLEIVFAITGKNYDDSWVGKNLTQEQRNNILTQAKNSTQKDIQQESTEEVRKILGEAAERKAEELINKVSKREKLYSQAELKKDLLDLMGSYRDLDLDLDLDIDRVTIELKSDSKNIPPKIYFLRHDDKVLDSFDNS